MASADLIKDRYIDELLGSSTVLDSVDSAAVAEAWASGAVAEWMALGGSSGQLSRRIADEAPLAAALITWMEGGASPAGDEGWLADVGQHVLLRAVRLSDSERPEEVGVVFEYEAPSGDRHDLSVTIVSNSLTGVAVGPEGVADAAIDDDTRGLTVEHVDSAEALGMVRAALEQPLDGLSAAAEATIPLLIDRVGLDVGNTVDIGSKASDRTIPERDAEDDRYSSDVIAAALRSELALQPTPDVEGARQRFAGLVDAGDPDALTVFEVAGQVVTSDLSMDQFVALVGAYLAPVDLSAHTDPQFAALVELEPADWVGVVLGMTRAPVGTPIDGDALVSFINRAPEITTTIPKNDAPRIAWTFEQMLFSWVVTGLLSDEGELTAAAKWLLPRAACAIWQA